MERGRQRNQRDSLKIKCRSNLMKFPSFAFRADASNSIGTGHVMRCLALADALGQRGGRSRFVCREHPGNLLNLIRQGGHEVYVLPAGSDDGKARGDLLHAHWLGTNWANDAEQTRQALIAHNATDWLVVDHYALDRRWGRSVRPHVGHIMVIDDLADRKHDCDLLLDQNLGTTESEYNGLVDSTAVTLIGPRYTLLRPEFAKWRQYSLTRRSHSQLKSILVSMGGVDNDNVTGKVLDALGRCELPAELRITVVMGPHAPWLAGVQARAETMQRPTEVLAGVSNMAELMANSDLAIGAAGGTAWERCALGLPTLMFVLAANQQRGANALQQAGAALVIREPDQLCNSLRSLLGHRMADLQSMSNSAAALVDGGGAARVVDKLLALDD